MAGTVHIIISSVAQTGTTIAKYVHVQAHDVSISNYS